MADEEKKDEKKKEVPPNPWEPVIFIVVIVGGLLAVAAYRGNLKNLGGQGFFQSPVAPVGNGTTYTPQNSIGLPVVQPHQDAQPTQTQTSPPSTTNNNNARPTNPSAYPSNYTQ